jgi:choline-sulfatase
MVPVHILLTLTLLATMAAAREPSAPVKAPLPDVYLITIDTLRADHVHCYGYDRVQTPALDALARDGVRFSQAFTPSPITNTSHTTILTGLLPSAHGVTDFAIPLSPAHATWAELLRKKGYHTAAFIGAVILDSKTLAPGLDRGFDFYDNFPENPQTKSRWGRVERRGMDVVQHAETWLSAHPAGPHFVWVHLYDPHDPYEPPAPYSQTYKDHLYDGEIAYADAALANFMDYLKKQGWYQNSLVVVVGDHGEGLGEHNEETHGIFLYDSTTHVPLIVKMPANRRPRAGAPAPHLSPATQNTRAGAPAPHGPSQTAEQTESSKVVGAQVRTTDILPTVLDLTGAPRPERLDGESLKPYLIGGESADRTAFGETDYPLRFGWAPLRSVRDGGFKLIEAPRPELYDLRADPGELKNVYERQDSWVQKLRGMLSDLKTRLAVVAPSTGSTGTSSAAEDSPRVPEPSSLSDPKDKIQEQNLLHAAMVAAEDNRPIEARSALEKVLQLDPKSPTALLQLGELELQAENYAKAGDYLGRARAVRPDDATAAYYQGQALEKSDDLTGARDALEASLKLTPSQFPARLLLGEVYLSLKNPQAAEDQFEAALLVQPKNVQANLDLAKAQIADGRAGDAIQQLETLAKSHPDNAAVFELLSQAYKGVGKEAAARLAQERANLLRSHKR